MSEWKIFYMGVFIGALSVFITLRFTVNIITLAHSVLRECEAELPRSVKCELTAIPVLNGD